MPHYYSLSQVGTLFPTPASLDSLPTHIAAISWILSGPVPSPLESYTVDISGTAVGESPDCLLLSGTGVGQLGMDCRV